MISLKNWKNKKNKKENNFGNNSIKLNKNKILSKSQIKVKSLKIININQKIKLK